MTPSRYLIARCGQFVGIKRKMQRMAEAAAESHLLREAEAYLGAATWEKVENIEPLTTEYWNLRMLHKQRASLEDKMTDCQERLAEAQEERATVVSAALEPEQKLLDRKGTLASRMELLVNERDGIIKEAREVRKTYEGLKMKLEFISTEENRGVDELEKVKARLSELKDRFTELKEARTEVGRKIQEAEAEIKALAALIDEARKENQLDSSGTLQAIGSANKEYTLLRADLAIVTSKIAHYQLEIGRYLGRNAGSDVACSKASVGHRGLISIMKALRRSILLNHRLAGEA